MVTIFYESHTVSVDNEAGIASGHRDVPLSETGRRQAREMGERHARREIAAVFCSDLRRASETAEIAFGRRGLPITRDARLRELDYGELTGKPRAVVRAEWLRRVDDPFPGGESARQAADRIRQFLRDLAREHEGATVVVIDHAAVHVALEHWLNGVPLQQAVAEDASRPWQAEWEYVLTAEALRRIEIQP